MGQRTPLYDAHVAAGASMVEFSGWDMPVNYGSQVAEHHAVRQSAGVFDVSHMTVVDLTGPGAEGFLRRLLANDVAKLTEPGRALYSVMCTPEGGVVDDLIVYRTADGYRTVVNCATREADLAWLAAQAAGFDVTIRERPELAMLAVQGPQAVALAGQAMGVDVSGLRPFRAVSQGDLFIARTGYTGEDGVEVILPAEAAPELWEALLAAGVAPAGLGARDTLRLEAGLNLYGSDLDRDTSPLESGLGWTVAWEPEDRDFVGRAALAEQREHPAQRQVGVVLKERGVMRAGQPVHVAGSATPGVITSGTFSPTLGTSIALARVPNVPATEAEVEIRGRRLPVDLVDPPFVRHGERQF